MTVPGSGPRDFDRLGELLPLGTGGATEPATSGAAPGPARPLGGDEIHQKLVAVWPEVVGTEVAANARPVQLRDGRLVATTSSSAWAQTLQLMSPLIVDRLNERLGEGTIDRAVFRHAGWESPVPAAPASIPDKTAKPHPAGRRKSPARTAMPPAAQTAAPLAPADRPGPAAGPTAATEAPAMPVPDDTQGLSAEERQALADLEKLPLAPAVKERIREAMKAGFVRARQDFGRS
jgi:hypothetical protein